NINIYNFFQVSGGFSLNKYTETMTLSDGNTVSVDLLTLGATGLDAFVGINGGNADEIGFKVEDVDLALSILKEKGGANRKWTSLYSTIAKSEFVGLSDSLTIESSDLLLEINKKASDGTVVDFAAKSLDIQTSASTSLTLNFDGARSELLRISGNLNLDIAGFFTVNGAFALSKSTETITLSDASTVTVDMMTIGANNVDSFIGINGGSDDELGFKTTGVNFGLALMTDQANKARKWTSLYATATNSSFVGINDLTVSASNVSLEINLQDSVDSLLVDYSTNILSIDTSSSTTIDLTMDGAKGKLLKVSASLDISVFGFFKVNGDFSFEKSSKTVILSDGSSVDVDLLTLGANNVSAFAGLNGGSVDQLGLSLTQVNFALAISTSNEDPTQIWTSLKAEA
ncbi:hypothetical protein MJH12_02120, partial [bacterium]|nr:hypothetical protein [bacterium]